MSDLTFKQRAFVNEYVANGHNATQAVLKVYNTSNLNSAHAIGSQNLSKLTVKSALENELSKLSPEAQQSINPEYILSGIKKIADKGKHDTSKLRAFELLGSTKYNQLFKQSLQVDVDTHHDESEADIDAQFRALINTNKVVPTREENAAIVECVASEAIQEGQGEEP